MGWLHVHFLGLLHGLLESAPCPPQTVRLPMSRPLLHVPTLSWVSISSRKPALCDETEADDTAVESLESSEGINMVSFPFSCIPCPAGLFCSLPSGEPGGAHHKGFWEFPLSLMGFTGGHSGVRASLSTLRLSCLFSAIQVCLRPIQSTRLAHPVSFSLNFALLT